MPRSTASTPHYLRIRVAPLPQTPTTFGVKLNPVRSIHNTPSNNRPFSPTHDFLLAQLWTRHIFTNSSAPTTTPSFENMAASTLSALNPDPLTPEFTSIQIRLRLNHLLDLYAGLLDKALSPEPTPIPISTFSKFHTFYPFLACEKPVRVATASDRGQKPWPTASMHLSFVLPRHPIISATPVVFHLLPSSPPPTASSAFNVLDDILLLQYWHTNIHRTTSQSTASDFHRIYIPVLQSLQTLHRITRRHSRPEFTSQALHSRLHFLFSNYVKVLDQFDRAPKRFVSLSHTAFLHFTVVFRYLQGCHVHIHDFNVSPTALEFMKMRPAQRSRALRAARRNRMRLLAEQTRESPQRRQTRPSGVNSGEEREAEAEEEAKEDTKNGEEAEAEAEDKVEAEEEAAAEDEQVNDTEKASFEVVKKGSKKVSADSMIGWETEIEVIGEDESTGNNIAEKEDPEVIIVSEHHAGALVDNFDKKRKMLEHSVKLEELDVRRQELAVKRHELMLKRGLLELECSEAREKRRRVDRDLRVGWKWETLREYAEMLETLKGNEVLESIAKKLIEQFKSEIEDA